MAVGCMSGYPRTLPGRTHSRTDHSIYFQVRMKGRLQAEHVAYSPATLFKEKGGEKKKLEKGGGGGALHKFYTHKAADKVIVASPKLFFPCLKNTFLAEWAPISDSIVGAGPLNGSSLCVFIIVRP